MAEIPEFKSTEKFQPTASPLGFERAAEKQAAAGNILTNIGSEIALRAGINRAEQAGIELGKNPKGDLLPVFNKTDEAFQNAYRNTGQATLTLKGQELINNGLNTVNSASKLSPGLIDNFSSQIEKGIEAISSQAPSIDRTAVSQNLKLGLINAKSKLDEKLAKQNTQELKDNFAAYTDETNTLIFDISSSGDTKGGEAVLSNLEQSVRAQVESGLLSPDEGENIIKIAKINHLTGTQFNKAQDARNAGKLDEYLSNYGKAPVEGMTPSEWVKVGNNLLTLLNFQDATDAKKQATLAAEIDLHIARNDVTNDLLLRAQEEQTPEAFIKTLTKLEIQNQKNQKLLQKIKTTSEGWSNPAKFALFEKDDINDTYDIMWRELAQKDAMDDWSAKTQIASTAGGAIPDYIKEFNARASTANPESIELAANALKFIEKVRAANLDGVDSKSRGMINSYERQKTANVDSVTAAKNAEQAIFNVDESELNKRNTQWVMINKKVFGNNNDRLEKGAKEIAGTMSSTNPVDFSLRVQEMYKDAYLEVGNQIDAQTQVQQYFTNAYGDTTVNGFKQEGQFGTIEQALQISENEIPLVQLQISEQAQLKLENYNKGNFEYKYKFKFPISVTLEDREAAQREYDEILKTMQFNNPRYKELKGILASAIQISPREVEIISNELAEITSRATLEETIKSKHFSTLPESEQIRLIQEGGNGVPANQATIDRIIELRKKIKAIENPGRPILQQIDSQGNTKDYYVGIVRAPNGQKIANQPVYYMRLVNMDNRMENFTGAMQHNGGELLYIPDIPDFEQKFSRYIYTASAGGEAAISDMRRKLAEHNDKATKFVEDRVAQDLPITVDLEE